METLVRLLCLVCFGSFGWGMAFHFRRFGKPSPAMVATGLLGVVCSGVQIAAIMARPVHRGGGVLPMYCVAAGLFWRAVMVTRGSLAACGQGSVSAGLVQDGPYRWIRHPFYASYNLGWIAGFAATGWWPVAVTAVVMAAVYEAFVRDEERGLLAGPNGAEYGRYRERTGKYWPKFGWPVHYPFRPS